MVIQTHDELIARNCYITHLQASEGSVDRCFEVILAPFEGRGYQYFGELVLALIRLDELHQVLDRAEHFFDQITLLRRGRFATLNTNDLRWEETGNTRRNDSDNPT